MDSTEQGLDLISQIYAATTGTAHWQSVADGLSNTLEGAAVVLSARLPDAPRASHLFVAGVEMSTAVSRVDTFLDRISLSHESRQPFARGFAFGPKEIESPALAHIIAIENGLPMATIVAFRAPGEFEFTAEQHKLANRLVPHLARAFAMSRILLTVARQRLALAEVMDRMPAGFILLNETGEVVHASRSAMRILRRDDGLSIVDDALCAEDKTADRALQERIADALTVGAGIGGYVAIPRTSTPMNYPVSVSRLLSGRSIRDSVVCVTVGDPAAAPTPAVELLRNLYDLTDAEADLVGHLARGHSLEKAATARGVSINTVRSQIKQVFQKTGTRRQGELVQLVLRCFMPMTKE